MKFVISLYKTATDTATALLFSNIQIPLPVLFWTTGPNPDTVHKTIGYSAGPPFGPHNHRTSKVNSL